MAEQALDHPLELRLLALQVDDERLEVRRARVAEDGADQLVEEPSRSPAR